MGKHATPALVPWGEIQKSAEAGVPLAELARRYGLSQGTVRARASRYKWLTASKLNQSIQSANATLAAQRAKLAENCPELLQTAAQITPESLAESGQRLRATVLRIATKAAEQVATVPLSVDSWQDFKTAAELGLKAAGVDSQQGPAVNILVQSDGITLSESTS